MKIDEIEALADVVHNERSLGATIASGSYTTMGMVVIPCSVKTLSAIANGYSENLISRAADVTLKERRRLVLVLRETPFHAGHLRLMTLADSQGAIIYPPVPSFHALPRTVEDVVDHTVRRILNLFEIDCLRGKEWAGVSPQRESFHDGA